MTPGVTPGLGPATESERGRGRDRGDRDRGGLGRALLAPVRGIAALGRGIGRLILLLLAPGRAAAGAAGDLAARQGAEIRMAGLVGVVLCAQGGTGLAYYELWGAPLFLVGAAVVGFSAYHWNDE